MKTIVTTLLVILASIINNEIKAQHKVLKINFGEEKNQWIMYPPNTKFTLKDDAKITVFSDKNDLGKFEINQKYTLEIFQLLLPFI